MGKWSLLLVLGFALTVLVVSPNIHKQASSAYENDLEYLKVTQSHNIAVSGANIACNQIFLNPSWRTGYSNVNFSGGKYTVTAQNYGSNQIKIDSYGQYLTRAETVTVILQPSSYAKFAYYSKVEGTIYWITGDTVWGPLHSQDKLTISGVPVFEGKVTTLLGTSPKKSTAQFLGGYQAGVNLDLPADLTATASAAGSGGKVFSTGDLWINFNNDIVQWKTNPTAPYTNTPLSTFAPNGVILVAKGSIHLQGTFHGQATLCATGSASSGWGNIYIDDNVKYLNDPRTGTSSDVLGLVTENNVIISDNAANNSDCILQASVFCRNGGLTAEHYDSRPIAGNLNLLGGIIQYQRGAVGTFSGSSLNHGYHKNYRYDDRFYVISPPYFPNTGSYEIISWLE
jgi:hypothetical protein